MTLLEFLLERLDEDKHLAEKVHANATPFSARHAGKRLGQTVEVWRQMLEDHMECGDSCPTLGVLVQPYKDHPDCKPEWPLDLGAKS